MCDGNGNVSRLGRTWMCDGKRSVEARRALGWVWSSPSEVPEWWVSGEGEGTVRGGMRRRGVAGVCPHADDEDGSFC